MSLFQRAVQALIAAHQPEIRECRECGEGLPTWKRSDAIYCDDTCRMRHNRRTPNQPSIVAHLARSCRVCGIPLESERATYCGATCRKRASRARARDAGGWNPSAHDAEV